MSIPGLGQLGGAATSAAPIIAAPSIVVHDVPANSEWRFEVAVGSSIDVRVLSGTAELFGTELAINSAYTFRGTKAAIFSWHGCHLEVSGRCEEYTAEETPMVSYINTHFALEKLRDESAQNSREGPRVLLVGPSNSGKTSLAKLLAAYAIRMGRRPMVINTDSREGILSIPGSLTATPFSSILDVEQGWGSSPTSGPSPVPVKFPLSYYFGLPSPEDSPKMYKPVLSRLALAATGRLAEDSLIKETGMIIDTPGVISQGKGSYDLISHIISEFAVNVILVLGSERLHSDMARRFSSITTAYGEPLTIVKLDKSGGCVDRDAEWMKQMSEASLKEYFFGNPKMVLSPQTQNLGFGDLTIWQIRTEDSTMGFLPGGEEEKEQHELYEKVQPSPQMMHCVMAVVYASIYDSEETIRDAPVMGFVYVEEVDEKSKRVKILGPANTRFSDRPLIWGSWPEATMSLMT